MNRLKKWAKSKLVQACVLGLASAAVVLTANRLGWFETAENKTLDWRFKHLTRPGQASPDIVIVELDNFSFESPTMLENFGRWPWRRLLYAGLVDYLNAMGARAIGIDLIFQGADAHAGDDAKFAEGLAERRDVLLAFAFNRLTFWKKDPAAAQKRQGRLAPFALQVKQQAPLGLKDYSGVDLPEDMFLRAVPSIGCVSVQTDPDGPIRRVTPLFRFGGRLYPSLPLAVFALAHPSELVILPGPKLAFAGREVPLDSQGRMMIRWYGGPRTYKTYPVWQVFNSALAYGNGEKAEIPPESFKNKIVLIGATATGTQEIYTNAFSEMYPGVEVHATVLDNFLRGDFLRPASRWVGPVAAIGLALLLAGVVYSFNSALIYTLLSLGLGGLYFAAASWLFRADNLWVPMVSPLVAGMVAFAGSTLTRYATEGREKRKYRKTLMKYLSPQLVETIMEDFNWASLRAEKRRLTVLFSDVRGFTTFSEKFPPETVIATLNEHLNMMVSVIFEHEGTLDKFVGDCVMAFWGAPLVQPNHAELAARAALEMIAGLEKLNQKWQSEGRPTLQIGVGINTGDMLFGNIGSEQRMDFTVIGDSVNLGARLESATKELHASIVISEATYNEIRDLAQVRPLGEISVKGKAQKIVVYELLGMAGAVQLKEAAS